MKNVIEMKKLFERRINMRKLLLLVFVALMCVPSYGDILVYKTTQTATVFDLAGGTENKETQKGFLVLDINLATQTINSAQQVTYSGTTQRTLDATVVFFDNVTGYILAEYSSGNTDAILFGKTASTDIGLDGKETIAKSLKGSTLNFVPPDQGSGTFTATLDSKTTKAKVDGAIDAVVTDLVENLTKYESVVDATPPVPSPMTFLLGGEPNAVSDTQIIMTATEATSSKASRNKPIHWSWIRQGACW